MVFFKDARTNIYAPRHSIQRVENFREAHHTISGLFTTDAAAQFMKELGDAVLPFVKAKRPWSVMGNLEGFIAQDRQTAAVIEKHLNLALDYGMVRLAWINPPALVSMQHPRLASRVNFEVFDNKTEAFKWLRD